MYYTHPPTHAHACTHTRRYTRTQACSTLTYTYKPHICYHHPRPGASSLNASRFCFVSSSVFDGLLEVTLFILRICNAGCLHWGACWHGPGWRLHYLWWGKKWQQSDRHQTDGGVENGNQKQSPRIWWKPSDTTFHTRHETACPHLPRACIKKPHDLGSYVRVLVHLAQMLV